MPFSVQLRNVLGTDVSLFYAHHLELVDEGDDDAEVRFSERWTQMLANEKVIVRTILVDGQVAGYVAHFVQMGQPAISYRLAKQFWGAGVATRAVQLFLPMIETRPMYARVAYDNVASLRVLETNGFTIVGAGRFFSERHGREVDEVVLALA